MCLGGWGESTTVTFWGLSNTIGFCQGSFKESIGDRKGICHVGELLIFYDEIGASRGGIVLWTKYKEP